MTSYLINWTYGFFIQFRKFWAVYWTNILIFMYTFSNPAKQGQPYKRLVLFPTSYLHSVIKITKLTKISKIAKIIQQEIQKIQRRNQGRTKTVSFNNGQESTQDVNVGYLCNFCDKIYIVKSSYQSHMRKKHSELVQSAKKTRQIKMTRAFENSNPIFSLTLKCKDQ